MSLILNFSISHNVEHNLNEKEIPEFLRLTIANILRKNEVEYEKKPSTAQYDIVDSTQKQKKKITRDTFCIHDGVLVGYTPVTENGCIEIPDGVRAIASNAFIGTDLVSVTMPDTVTKIYDSAFANCHLQAVYLSKNIEYIGPKAFANNNLDFFEIPENITNFGKDFLADNPGVILVAPPHLKIDKIDYPINKKILALVVHNDEGQALETIEKFKDSIFTSRVAVINGNELTHKEKSQVKRMLKKSMFFEISHIEYTPSVAKSSLASFLESIKDPETKKIIERIFDLIPDSLIEYRSDIEKRVIEKIDIYQSELERLKKDVITNDATEDLPNLTVSESNPLNLKVKLLIDLETIYSEVKRKSLELAFINEIHGYKALLDGTIELEKKDTTTPEGQIAFIVNVSSRYGVESLKDELNKLLEQTEERVNITANSESFQGNVSDLKTSFNIDLMALYNMARHYQKYYDSLFDLENSELAKDISIFKRIISSLDDEAPSIYSGLLEELLDKYKKFGINMDREEYEKSFRKELERMLEKVGTKISSIETHRNILMGINNSLKTLVEGQAISNPHNTIESMVNDILELLKTSLLEKETAQQYREKLKELLESLYAQNLKDEQKESNPNTLSDPLNCPSNLHIFKENILLEIEALKALAKLKYEIEFDLMKLQHIDKYKL